MAKEQTKSGTEQAQLLLGPGHKGFGNGTDPSVGADTQFTAGESGNPKGRPKGRKNLSTMIQEMMNDPKFIDRLSQKIKSRVIDADMPDPEFQGTPMKAIVTTAMIEAMDPSIHPTSRHNARNWLRQGGWGTQVDVTSKGERIADTPKIISVVNARQDDALADPQT